MISSGIEKTKQDRLQNLAKNSWEQITEGKVSEALVLFGKRAKVLMDFRL